MYTLLLITIITYITIMLSIKGMNTYMDYANISDADKQLCISTFNNALNHYNNTKQTQKGKKIRITDYTKAINIEELQNMKGSILKNVLDKNNMNKNGNKEELAKRVWWILHPETPKPNNIDKKKRGRPAVIPIKGPAFINDDSSGDSELEEECDNIAELLRQYDTQSLITTWNKVYIDNSNKVSKNGITVYKYKSSNFIFKNTMNDGYVPYGIINTDQTITTINMNNTSDIPHELQTILSDMYN